MDTQQPIACNLHDYIETFCVYRYKLQIIDKHDKSTVAIAKDTTTIKSREYLVVARDDTVEKIALDEIKQITVLTPNPKYDTINFL